MNGKTPLALALFLALYPYPIGAEEGSGNPGIPVSVCDSSRNRETWYWSLHPCGPTPSQFSFVANVAGENVTGSQAAFFANVAQGRVENVQAAFLFNYADSIHGSQWAWDFNLARKVDGFQVGGLNVADTVDGTQVGFLNISRHLDGYGIGIFTFARNSMLHGDVRADETGMAKIGFTTGKGFFTTHTLGYTVAEDNHPYGFGMGFGYQAPYGWGYLEGELGVNMIMDEATEHPDYDHGFDHAFYDDFDDDFRYNTHLQAKLRVGGRLTRWLSLFGSITGNSLITHGEGRLIAPWSDELTGTLEGTYYWPGYEIGIRLGR